MSIEVVDIKYHCYITNYHAAVLYCKFLDVDGYKDWRLPTYEEYMECIAMNNSYTWYHIEEPIIQHLELQVPPMVIAVRDIK